MLIQSYRIRFGLMTLIVAALLLQGCAVYRAQNNPVEGMTDPLQGYRLMYPQRDYGDVPLLMSFSGGGTRAAAFSYGALKTLRDTSIGEGAGKWRLLDKVDLISSVSGGSFTAAYYGLHGDGTFQRLRGGTVPQQTFIRESFDLLFRDGSPHRDHFAQCSFLTQFLVFWASSNSIAQKTKIVSLKYNF